MFSRSKEFNTIGRDQKVCVQTLDAELEFDIQQTTTGKQLFNEVAKALGLRETWFFGLKYKDSRGNSTWLDLRKVVLQNDMIMIQPLRFQFCVKFFPESVENEIIQDVTLRLFYLQVKDQIVSDVIQCTPDACVFMASYSMQVKFGDYDADHHAHGTLPIEKLIPKRMFIQYHLSEREWEHRIVEFWQGHKEMLPESAMLNYLKYAQEKTEMFGVTYFEVQDKKGENLLVGVYAQGLNFYSPENQVTPKRKFTWSEISSIETSKEKEFIVRFVDKKIKSFSFYTPSAESNNEILLLCMGNHELYLRRRKPESPQVQQMKKQASKEQRLIQLSKKKISSTEVLERM